MKVKELLKKVNGAIAKQPVYIEDINKCGTARQVHGPEFSGHYYEEEDRTVAQKQYSAIRLWFSTSKQRPCRWVVKPAKEGNMTKAEAKALKIGDKVVNRDGVEYTVLAVNGFWKGFLKQSEVQARIAANKYDGYAITVRNSPFLQYDHKDLWLVK